MVGWYEGCYFLSSEHGITVTTLSILTTRLEQFSVHCSIFRLFDSLVVRPVTLPTAERDNSKKLTNVPFNFFFETVEWYIRYLCPSLGYLNTPRVPFGNLTWRSKPTIIFEKLRWTWDKPLT